jgi:hypothetical protein
MTKIRSDRLDLLVNSLQTYYNSDDDHSRKMGLRGSFYGVHVAKLMAKMTLASRPCYHRRFIKILSTMMTAFCRMIRD